VNSGANTIVSSVSHTPPRFVGAAQTTTGTPPSTATFRSFSFAK
jgi:hypothetical protein